MAIACALLVLVLLAPVTGTQSTAQSTAQSSVQSRTTDETQLENLDDWLNVHRLERLSLRLAEIRLSRELDLERQKRLASKLAKIYRVQLLSNPADSKIGQVVSKAERLSQNYPQVETGGLQLAISHARYVEAEQGFLEWWQGSAAADRREVVLEKFRNVLDRLQQQIDLNNGLLQNTLSILPYDDRESRSLQRQLDEIESRLVHAYYLQGWTSYFMAVIPFQNDSRQLAHAQSSFYRTLRIEQEKPIDQIDSKWLDFSSPMSRRTLLGLALVYTAQSQSHASRFCLRAAEKLDGDPLESKTTQFNALAYSKQWDQAVELARSMQAEPAESDGQRRFWLNVVEAGFAGTQFDAAAAKELQRIGLLGLLREFDANAIKRIVEEKAIQLSTDRFEDLWIKGLLTYHLAEDDTNRLIRAESLLQSALDLAGVDREPRDLSRIRYLQALIEFKMNNPGETIRLLDWVPDSPDLPDLTFSENRLWLRCRGLIALSQNDSVRTGQAMAAINDFTARFPQSPFLPTAEFERLKLANSLLPAEEALQIYSEIHQTDRNFIDAQFEMVRCQYRLWTSAHESREASDEEAFDALVSRDRLFRELPGIPAEQQLSSLLFVIDASLKRETEKTAVDCWLASAERIVNSSLIEGHSGQSQLMYYRFRGARKFGDDRTATKSAQWIAKYSDVPGYQLSAIAWLAKTADESGDTPVNELIEIYRQLADRLGTDKETLASSQNARAASGRLVELYIDSNRLDEARQLNTLLLALNSNQEQLILNAARIESQSGRLSDALTYWRKLARGSETGTPAWLESKLGMVACLIESDPEKAAQVYRQTVNLAGEITGQWHQRIAQMGVRLEQLNLANTKADPDER